MVGVTGMWPGMSKKDPVGLGLEMMILSSWNLAVDHIVLFLFICGLHLRWEELMLFSNFSI